LSHCLVQAVHSVCVQVHTGVQQRCSNYDQVVQIGAGQFHNPTVQS